MTTPQLTLDAAGNTFLNYPGFIVQICYHARVRLVNAIDDLMLTAYSPLFPSEGCVDGWIDQVEEQVGGFCHPGSNWEFDWDFFQVERVRT